MPDFFKGEPAPLSLYPADTDEKKKTAMEFMAGPANIDKNVDKLMEAVKEAKGKCGTVKSWGIYGLCWGGKACGPSPWKPRMKCNVTSTWLRLSLQISILASGPNTDFKAAGTAHPGYAFFLTHPSSNPSISHTFRME